MMTTNEPRYYIDGKPAKVINIAPNGFMNVVYDGAVFLTYIQVGEAHDWEPIEPSDPSGTHAVGSGGVWPNKGVTS